MELLLVGWLCQGHVLIEDIPGVGKTTLARALALASGGSFQRLQCTPDLMPGDITGVSIFDEQERRFVFHPGPVFADVLLADELNRTPPRTQSALLEALAEGHVTVDGQPRPMPAGFFCIATQNPVESHGTYPLPESQLDRFLLRFGLGYPPRDHELSLLASDGTVLALTRLQPVLDGAGATALRAAVAQIHIAAELQGYVLDLVQATRQHPSLRVGASPRAAIGLQRAARARALLAGRDYVLPDDVQALAGPCLAHRVVARGGADADEVLTGIVTGVAVPR
jgi:MoxR-like ATPase